MSGPTPHALIAGGGIAGLSAALALARAGLRATIIERASLFEEIGAGLQISPNAACILDDWGVLERLSKSALAPASVSLRSFASGRELARVPVGESQARWGAPYLVVHRADLARALLEAVALHPGIAFEPGLAVAGFAAGADKVAVALRRGLLRREMSGDLLIGADGLHSTVRAKFGFGPSDAPVHSGRTAWRATIDAALLPDSFHAPRTDLWLGPAAHLVHYPLRQGTLVNVVAVIEDRARAEQASDDWNAEGDAAMIARAFAKWAPDARTLIAAAPRWRVWPLFERAAAPRFSDGRVALVGDAAHPMLPFLAQGAAQAIEDAAALGAALAGAPDVAGALAAYSRARLARAAKVVVQAKRQGRIYHLRGPAALARDFVLRRSSPQRLLARYDWLYGYKLPGKSP